MKAPLNWGLHFSCATILVLADAMRRVAILGWLVGDDEKALCFFCFATKDADGT
jgi:hypothetical protein